MSWEDFTYPLNRAKPWVRVKFEAMGKKPKWYWAIKVRDGVYKRVTRDGDTAITEHKRADGTWVKTEELLVGEPLEERKAVLNLHYGQLEEVLL